MLTPGEQIEFEDQPSDTLPSTENPIYAVQARTAGTTRSRSVPPPDASSPVLEDDPLVGRVIHGRFRILDLIACGGMGRVYRAEQAPLGRICALKILHPRNQSNDDPGFQKRFFLEAATAAKLSHPNTVTVFDYGRDGDVFFIAMELIQGRTLYRRLRQEGPMHEALVVHVISQAARSLREAHHLGTIHRDIKPANIAIDEAHGDQFQVKVLDFGLVKELADDSDDLTLQGLFMGSPKYMAPEQILGNPVSAATDVYALGIVAYELLVGRVPFDGGSAMKTLMAQLNQTPPALSSVRPDIEISSEVVAIVMRCLHKDPAHRYASMDALLEAFSELTNDWSSSGVRLVQPPSSRRNFGQPEQGALADRARNTTFESSASAEGSSAEGSSAQGSSAQGVPVQAKNGPSETPAPMHHSLLPAALPTRPRWSRLLLAALAGAALVLAMADLIGLLEWPASNVDSTARVPSDAGAPAAASKRSMLQEVTVRSTPPGAGVASGGKQLCIATPCILAVSKGQIMRLRITKVGYAPITARVGTETRQLHVELVRAASKAVQARSVPKRLSASKTVAPKTVAPKTVD